MPVGMSLARCGVFQLHRSDRPDGNAILLDEEWILIRAVSGAAILNNADAPGRDLIDYAMIEQR